jgi:peptidoglycan-associated lipoprotein
LGVPMNSSYDDFGITFSSPKSGYFTSNRVGGKGDDDIYEFSDNTPPETKKVNYFLAGLTITHDDKGAEQILDNVNVRMVDEDGNELNKITTGTTGDFKFPIQIGHVYTLVGEKKDYLTKREVFSSQGLSIPQELLTKAITDTTFEIKIPLEKIVIDKSFVLENIYYDLDKYNIREDAAEELDKLVEILEDNPTIKIELSSHTDTRGEDEYNMRLSQRRAESAVNYIISKGIAPERMVARGYGETQLRITNAVTEEEHQVNRRTEFKVLEYTK